MSAENQYSDEQLITAVLKHTTLREAADEIGCSTKTLQRRLEDPELQQAIEEAKWYQYELAYNKLQMVAAEAVDTLISLMRDDSLPPKLKGQICCQILRLGRQTTDLMENKLDKVGDSGKKG